MDLNIKGKVALITASSNGLGYNCAKALTEEGCNVVISSRNEQNISKAAAKIRLYSLSRTKVSSIVADMETKEGIETVYTETVNNMGSPDILIINIGGPPKGSFDEIDTEMYEKWLGIGIARTIDIIKLCVPSMKNKMWGRIIAITSMSVKQPIQNLIISNTFRAGLTGFLKTISTNLAEYNITVNSLLPGMHAMLLIDC